MKKLLKELQDLGKVDLSIKKVAILFLETLIIIF